MSLLNAAKLAFSYSHTPLLRDVTFSLMPGEKAALVGWNGSGKSTLLRLLAGALPPDGGSLIRQVGLRVSWLEQEQNRAVDTTLYDTLLAGNPAIAAIRTRWQQLESQLTGEYAAIEFARVVDEYRDAGGYAWESEVEAVLTGLGFPEESHHRSIAELSSGGRVRAALARCLLSGADLLLLDEPTNHLDTQRREWLEGHLSSLPAACIIASHDRTLLNRVTSRTLWLERGELHDYPGNLDAAHELRNSANSLHWRSWEGQQRRIAAAEAAAQRRDRLAAQVAHAPPGVRQCQDFYARKSAKVARTSRILRERVQLESQIDKPWEDTAIPPLTFAQVPECGLQLLSADRLAAGYDGVPVFQDVSLHVQRGERWSIQGPNGSGKTTLLKILAGLAVPQQGRVSVAKAVRRGYFAQELDHLDSAHTAVEICRQANPDESFIRTILGCLRLPANQVNRPVATLSGGERTKVALGRLMVSPVNLLLLDEPTNHLEAEAIDALANTLKCFPGAVVFVSHDRSFTRAVATQTLAL